MLKSDGVWVVDFGLLIEVRFQGIVAYGRDGRYNPFISSVVGRPIVNAASSWFIMIN